MPSREPVEFDELREPQENLASIFQECFTIVGRLRTGAVSEEAPFRRRVIELLRAAQENARRCEYSDAAGKSCVMALVAFLDESVLNSTGSSFEQWRGKPLQEELYGHSLLGDKFFDNLKRLLAQDDGDELADVLEVYYLCLLLGFRGRYAVSSDRDLNVELHRVENRLSRLRAPSMTNIAGPLGALRGEGGYRRRSTPRLLALAAIAVLAAILLFAGFHYSLSSAANIDSLVAESERN
jgi:type VI secretion system protein ImpK